MIRRFYLTPGSPATLALMRRCASASELVDRYQIGHGHAEGVDGARTYVRARLRRTRDTKYRQKSAAKMALEVDLVGADGLPIASSTVASVWTPSDSGGLLGVSAKAFGLDRCVVWFGTWGEARLQVEDRQEERRVLLVDAPPGWAAPPEWVGGVEVTQDPRWQRHVLTRETWPAMFRSRGPLPESAW